MKRTSDKRTINFVFCLALFAAVSPAAGQDARRATRAHVVAPPQPQSNFKAPPLAPETRREFEAKLAAARKRFEQNPDDPDAVIWLGRRTAYLGRFEEAIDIFTEGIRRHPRDARLYRHRGHRLITLRRFRPAVEDLKQASKLIKGRPDEVEPDGLPNARNIPTSTLHSNVWYHLGLAYYLSGDFRRASDAYRECIKFSTNPDMLSATAHWLYMTLRRLKREEEARRILNLIDDRADIIENRDYHRLILMYKGTLSPDWLLREASKNRDSLGFATTAYGVGNWHLYNNERERAKQIFLQVIAGPQQTSFGYIAAESELRRMGLTDLPRAPLPQKTIY